MNIGERIKSLRKKRGMTQTQLSELSGVPVRSIQDYEAGKRNPKMESRTKLAVALQVPVQTLLDIDNARCVGDVIQKIARQDPLCQGHMQIQAERDKRRILQMADKIGIKIAVDEDVHLNFGIYLDEKDYSLDEIMDIMNYVHFVRSKRNDYKL